jgi:hypothetical protein
MEWSSINEDETCGEKERETESNGEKWNETMRIIYKETP